MIDAEIYTQADGKIFGFALRGHNTVGKRGHGYNVHCAEVSTISQAACLSIARYLNRDAELQGEHGGLAFELKTAPDDLTEAVFQMMLIGFRAVKQVAPDVIAIKTVAQDAEALQQKINAMQPTPPNPLPTLHVADVRIRAEIFRDDADNVTGFNVNERRGKVADEFEIYRAGVWSLVKATLSCVKNYLQRDLEFKTESRRLSLKLKTAPDYLTEAVFQTMLIGLREIEKLAPKIINVTEIFSSRR